MRTHTIRRESLSLPPYEAPDGQIETAITEIFAEVFGLDRVGVTVAQLATSLPSGAKMSRF